MGAVRTSRTLVAKEVEHKLHHGNCVYDDEVDCSGNLRSQLLSEQRSSQVSDVTDEPLQQEPEGEDLVRTTRPEVLHKLPAVG